MEKGIEDEENNLYKQTEDVANNVLDSLDNINPNIGLNGNYTNPIPTGNIDYNKLFNILYEAFLKALTNCKFTLDEDGFAKIVKDELYKVV